MNLTKKLQKTWDFGIGRTALAAVCAHSVSISIGICQGYSAILIPQLTASEDFVIDAQQGSWIASLGVITNPVGSILSGLLAEYAGRKKAIQLSSFPFLIGWICLAVAPNIWWLYIGRLITGIAAGMSAACYTYVTEISTPETRGTFQALGPISASFGILLTYTLGYFLRWHLVAAISVTFALYSLISMQFLPESPPYLLKKMRRLDCLNSLMWFRRSNAVAQEEYEQLSTKNESDAKDQKLYLTPKTMKPFFILVALFLLQEFSGIYSILFYAVNFFRDSNLDIDEHIASIIVGLIRFAMSVAAAILINRCGRKSLCVASSAGMTFSFLLAVVYFKYYEIYPTEVRTFRFLPLICMLCNVLFSMIGMLPIPWILVGELFPLRVRSIMSGIVICIAQCFIFVCVKIYPDMIAYLNFSGTLLVFLMSSFLAVIFTKFVLPETKNKTLEEIELNFARKNGVDNRGFVMDGP